VLDKTRHLIYVVLYTLFWSALAVITFRILFEEGMIQLGSGPYFFITGLFYLVCSVLRIVSRRQAKTPPDQSDPVIASFAIAGLLLTLYANLS
jgi:cytochrome b561